MRKCFGSSVSKNGEPPVNEKNVSGVQLGRMGNQIMRKCFGSSVRKNGEPDNKEMFREFS